MFDVNTAVTFAISMCAHHLSAPETTLAMNGLNSRQAVARRIAGRFPEFGVVVSCMEKTDGADDLTGYGRCLVQEFETIQRYATDREILADVDFIVLFAGMLGLMERFEEPEKNDARILLRALEIISAQVEDDDAIAIVLMAFWFADYRGFRAKLLDRLVGS